VKRALVLGASGGMGYSIVKELSNRGYDVIALSRTKEKLVRLFDDFPNVKIYPGDVFDLETLNGAANGVDVIFHAINLPYGNWETDLSALTNNVIVAARNHGAKLAIVDNIYAYGRNPGSDVTEATPKKPHTKKGMLRLDMEKKVKSAGVPFLIVHFPDFYGPHVENGMINYTLRQILADKKGGFVGDQTVAREFIYTPDGAKAIVELAFRNDVYGQNWNIPGYGLIKGEDIISIIRHLTGYTKKVSTITHTKLRLVGLFSKQMRELVEMQYLNVDPVVLDGQKYEKAIGKIPRTSYEDGIRETIKTYA